jgi:hypothetical protein
MKTNEPQPKILGDTKQKQVEKIQKARALEGKKLKGQQTLTSAICTSHRLTEFEEDRTTFPYPVVKSGRLKITDAQSDKTGGV